MKRAFSLLLALCLVLTLLPFGTFAATSGTTAAGQTAAATAAASDATTYLAFSSDAHNKGDNTSANRVDQWINNVTAKVGDDIDVMSYCGDYGSASAGESDFWTYAQAIMNASRNNAKVHDCVFTTGNHEYYNGRYGSTSNAVAENITRIGEARNASNYIIYCFGPKDGNGDRYDTEDLGILDSYLGGLPAADREKPIFILTHYPAHTASGGGSWGGWGMSRSTTNADQLISTLNKYGEQGYDIYYLWGHNHTVSDTHYDEVYTGTLDGTEIKFTYLAAGCMSDRDYSDGSAYVKGKGLLVGIDDAGEVVSMNYYDANANDVTENASGSETPAPTTQPTAEPTVQPTEIVSDVAVTPSTDNPTVSATIEVGDTLTIAVTNGSTSNAYDFTASLSGSGVAELQGSSTVNIAKSATAAFTVTGLAPGTVDINIQNQSAYSQFTRKATIHLTVVSGGTTPTPEPTAEPTVEPTTEPVVVSEVSVTPTTSNPAESATIRVGDTLAIRVTNSSTYSDYDFTASLSAGGVAQIQGDATINVARSATGTFTVTGLAPGPVDVNIQNDNGQYTRKATIHLTVVSGGTTPIECDHPDIDVVGEKAPSCTEEGYNGDLVCAVCGELLETGESIPALGHTAQRVNVSEATCTAAGYTGDDVCTRCGETVAWGYELPALGHDYQGAVTAPTCTEQGYTTYTCSRCSDSYVDDYADALGHSWDDGVVTQQPTGSAEGVKTFTCTRCGETRTEPIPKLVNPFKDVPAEKYYTDAILWAVNQEPQITNGYVDDTFRPDQTCTRAQVVTFLWRAAGEPKPETTVNPFKDVSASAYYYQAVLWAVENHITEGYPDGTFRPNTECTRAQVVTFLWRAQGFPKPERTDNPFTDVSPSAYYYQAVLWANENGITTGNSATTFNPNGACARAHVVTFLYRATV